MSMRVHVIETGRLVHNKTFWRGEGWSALFRRAEPFAFPAYAYVLEHPEGHIAIDTGLDPGVRPPRGLNRRFVPVPSAEPADEIGPRMRAMGLRPEDVRWVVLTHLDWDHAGGVRHFPNAEILVHRPEFAFASTLMGKLRYQPKRWPEWFSPTLYDLDPEPYVSFPQSKRLTDRGDVIIVPTRGHSAGHVGVIARTEGGALFFGGDHMLRQDWYTEDYAAGRLLQLGQFFPDDARETSRRIHRFAEEVPTVLLPAHDDGAAARLAAMELLPV